MDLQRRANDGHKNLELFAGLYNKLHRGEVCVAAVCPVT